MNFIKTSFSVFDKPIKNTNALTHATEKKMTADIRNDVFIIFLCIRKTNKDANNVMANAGSRNDFIYSE
jgi:hypothetical protein